MADMHKVRDLSVNYVIGLSILGIFTAPLMIKSNDSPLSLIVGSFPLSTLIKTVLSHNRNGSSPQHDE